MSSGDLYRWNDLATYNAEVWRGIVHTPEWQAQMAAQQEQFNAEQDDQLRSEGWTPLDGGGWIRVPDTKQAYFSKFRHILWCWTTRKAMGKWPLFDHQR